MCEEGSKIDENEDSANENAEEDTSAVNNVPNIKATISTSSTTCNEQETDKNDVSENNMQNWRPGADRPVQEQRRLSKLQREDPVDNEDGIFNKDNQDVQG